MLVGDMQIGKTLEILCVREGYKYRFVSKVEGVSGSSVAVSLIANANRAFIFEEKDDITIVYRGVERMWKWEHARGGLAKLDGYPVHTFTSVAEGTSYNRRESFRVPFGEVCQMNRIRTVEGETDEDGKPMERLTPFETLLSDLSSTGAGFFTNETIALDDEICFDLPTNMGILNCRGKLVREAEVYDKPYRRFYGLEFTKVSSGLDRYLTEKQRLLLQRERGGVGVRKK